MSDPERRQPRIALLVRALRRAVYPLAALPLGVWALVLALAGRRARAGALEAGLIHKLLPPEDLKPVDERVLSYSLLSLPVNALAFAFACYVWLILPVNLGYPLRPDVTDESLRTGTWGGPTLAGAWGVHAVGAVLFFVLVGLPILNGVARLQGHLAQGLLGGRRT
jgi:hypothetical protein